MEGGYTRANKQIPNSEGTQFSSGVVAVENGRKGGFAKARNERRRKSLRESMNALLEMKPTAKEIKELEKAGFDPDEINNSLLVILGLFNQAKKGNVKAVQELRNLVGEDGPNNGDGYESDGFIEALKDDMKSTIEKAGDFVET